MDELNLMDELDLEGVARNLGTLVAEGLVTEEWALQLWQVFIDVETARRQWARARKYVN